MKKNITKILSVLLITLFSMLGAKAQLFQQQFGTTFTTPGSTGLLTNATYVNTTSSRTNAQFSGIAVGSSTSMKVYVPGTGDSANSLIGNRQNGGNLGVERDSLQASGTIIPGSYVAPTSMILRFDYSLYSSGTASQTVMSIQVGALTSTDRTSGPIALTARTAAYFTLDFLGTGPGFFVGQSKNNQNVTGRTYTATNKANKKSIYFVLNHSGSPMVYKAPNGAFDTVPNNKHDVWIGTTREMNDISDSTSSALSGFLIGYGATTTSLWSIDNLLADPIPAVPTSSAATSLGASSFTANWSTVAGVTGYYIDVATDAAFTSMVSGLSNVFVSGQATNSYAATVPPGGTYYYRVRAASVYTVDTYVGGNSATQTVALSCTNPTINTDPSTGTQTVCAGVTPTNLSISATGASSYQWYSNTSPSNSNGTLISGAASSTYIPSTSSASNLYYYCVALSGACSTTSNVSGLIIVKALPTPTFISSPGGTSALNTSVTYTTQNGQSSYVWSVPGTAGTNYTIISGGISSTDSTVTLTWSNTGSKTVTVNYSTNGCAGASAASNTTTVFAGAFYNKANSDITDTLNWSTNSNGIGGSGTHPADFVTAGQTFNLFNAGATMSGTWTVSGSNSKVVVGDGANAVTFTASQAFTATVDVANAAILQIQTTTIPTFGTLSSGSTVEYGGSSITQVVTATSYSNLTLSGSGSRTFSGTTNISGTFNPGSGFSGTSGSTIVLNGTSAGQAIPAFTYSGLTISGVDGKSTTGNLSVAGALTMNNSFTIATGNTLTFNSTATIASTATKTLTVNGTFDDKLTAQSFNAGSGAMTVNGTFKMSGMSGASSNTITLTNVTFASGTSGGTLYIASGVARLSGTYAGNVVWDVASEATNPILTGTTTTTNIGGNFTVKATGGGTNGIYFNSGNGARSLVVAGDVFIQGGTLTLTATATGTAACTLTANNLSITGGNLYVTDNTATGATLNIKGNLTHTSGILGIGSGSGTIAFNGTTMQDISTIGLTGAAAVTLNNSSGARLLNDFSFGGNLTLTSGKLRTNGFSVIMTGSTSTVSGASFGAAATSYIAICDGNGAVSTTGGLTINSIGTTPGRTGAVTFPIGTSTSYNPVTVSNSGTAVAFTTRVNTTAYAGTTSDSTVARTWNIQPASGTPNAIIGLQWNGGEEGANYNRTSTSIGHYNSGTSSTDVYSSGGAAANPVGSIYTLNSGSTSFTNSGDFGLIPGIIIPAPVPTFQVTNASVTPSNTSMTINWTVGDGNSIVVVRQGSAVNSSPVDAASYTGNALFGSGSQIGSGNYVVYTGAANSVVVTGLAPGTLYYVAVYSFNGSNGTENYLTTDSATASGTTTIPTYYYVGGVGGTNATNNSWNSANQWSSQPGGTALAAITPTANDVFIFDGSKINVGGTLSDSVTILAISSTTTVGKIILQNNARVAINSGGGNRTMSVGNSAFAANTTAISVPPGSKLYITANQNVITLATNSSADIGGSFYLGNGGGASQLIPGSSGSFITVDSAAYFEFNSSSTSTKPFGAGTATTVSFAKNATFKCINGGDVFGATTNGVVSFATGSLCWYVSGSSSGLTMSGRTFGDLRSDFSMGASTGSLGFSVDNLTVSAGTLTLNESGTNHIKGNINISTGATLKFNAASTCYFDGLSLQTITNNGTWTLSSSLNQSFILSNTAGLSIVAGTGVNISGLAGTSFTTNSGCNLNLESGVLNIGAGTLNINGTLSRTTGTITASTIGAVVNVAGASTLPSGLFTSNTVRTLTINRSAGVSIGGDITVSTALNLQNGIVATGSNTISMSAGTTLTKTNGWINGNLRKNFGTGSAITRTFEIGDATNYTPATVIIANVTTAGDLTVRTDAPATAHPNYATAPISNTNYISRYWTLTNANTLAYSTTYKAVFTYAPTDVVGTSTSSSVVLVKYNAGWSKVTPTSTGTYTDSAAGITTLGSFILADDCITVTPAISISATNAISSNTAAICSGGSITFTATPTNPGTAATYQWKKNSTTNIGTGLTTLTLPDNQVTSGDVITCVMTPNNNCQTLNSVTSNSYTLLVGTVTPSVSIATSTGSSTLCSGNAVSFIATGVNPGSLPKYRWFKNGSLITTGPTFDFNNANDLHTGDVIVCALIPNNACQSSDSVVSNSITLTVNQSPVAATISSQYGSSTTALTMCDLGSSITVYPSLATGVWSSSNNNFATVARGNNVSYSANVVSVANGTANITYTLTTPNTTCITATTIAVTVNKQATPSSITTASGLSSICVNNTDTFKTASTGGVFSALGRLNINGSTGFATATSAGTTSVIYTITNANGCSAHSSLNVTVNPLPATPNIAFATGTISPAGSGGYCKNRTFTLVGSPANGVWSKTGVISATPLGSNSTTTSVSTGNITGAATITYAYTANGCKNSRTITTNIVACATKGINNEPLLMNNSFTLYPNPTRSIINLNVKALVGAGSIVVTDLYGKQLKTQALSIGTNTIDVSSFAKGMYFVSIITESGKQTQKVVVE